jgi:RimK family alpha-L-glutamate ligase
MKFHLLYHSIENLDDNAQTVDRIFKDSCDRYDIKFVPYDTRGSLEISTLPQIGKGDMLYRASTASSAIVALRHMISDSCTTFYTDWKSAYTRRVASYFIHHKHGFPVVPSFSGIPVTEEELQKCVDDLGPFPIIVKVMGGSLGVGVMRLDSIKSLRSVLDYLRNTGASVLLRKYIPHDYYVRAIVVGDEVVAAHAAYTMDGEFRTNAGDDTGQKRKAINLPEEVKKMLVEAVRVLGIETGGVDLLYDKDGTAYIAEVNFPNNFTVTQKVTGINIGDAMLRHLMKKVSQQDVRKEWDRKVEYHLGTSHNMKEN